MIALTLTHLCNYVFGLLDVYEMHAGIAQIFTINENS